MTLYPPGSAKYASLGYDCIALPVGQGMLDAMTSTSNLFAAGGTILVPVKIAAPFRVQAVRVRNADTATARSWGWSLYRDDGSTTLQRVAASNGSDAFTPAAASFRTLAASGAPVDLQPGLYWIAFQNTHATSTFGLSYAAAHANFGASLAVSITAAQAIPLGDTLDMSQATTQLARSYSIMLLGRAMGGTGAYF